MEFKYSTKVIGIFAASVLAVFCLSFFVTRIALGDIKLFSPKESGPPEDVIEVSPTPTPKPTPIPIATPEPTPPPEETPELKTVELENLKVLIENEMAVLSPSSIWGVYIENMADGSRISVYNNAETDTRMSAGGLMNLYIMISVYEALELEKIMDTTGLRDDLALLMSQSDVEAANRLITELGKGEIDAGLAEINLTAKGVGCFNTTMQTLTSDFSGEYTNYTTAGDCALALRKIYHMDLNLVSEAGCREMMELLLLCQNNSRIPNGISMTNEEVMPEGVKIAHVGASTQGELEADVGIVFTGDSHYIISVIANPSDNSYAAEVIRAISAACYRFFAL